MATKANISIDQGTTFSTVVALTDDAGNPLNLTAYSANSQIRKWYTSSNSVAFTTELTDGDIILSMNAATTGSLSAGRYVYDVTVTDNANNITRVVEGIVTVNPRVTR